MNQKNKPGGWIWETHLKLWNQLGPPLRPSWADLDIVQQEITAWGKANRDSPAQALVYGVTPEYPAMNWPAGSRVFALDRSQQMISLIWYASARFAGGAMAGTWETPPVRDKCIDLVLGDGCFTLLPWESGYRQVLAAMRTVLRPGGRVVMRCFTQRADPETVDNVFTDLAAGRIDCFNAFKWRLAIALHGSNPAGVRLGDVWDTWHRQAIDVEALAVQTGWSTTSIRSIDTYRDMDIHYSFPDVQALRALCREYFTEAACHTPASAIGEHIRILVLEH